MYGKVSLLRFLIIVYMKESKNTALCFLLRFQTSRDTSHGVMQNLKLMKVIDSCCHMKLLVTALLDFIFPKFVTGAGGQPKVWRSKIVTFSKRLKPQKG